MTTTVRPSAWDSADRLAATGRALVVEQHAMVAMGLQLALSACDWTVEVAAADASTADVVGLADRFRPACVLLGMHPTAGAAETMALIAPLVATGAKVLVITAERRRVVLAECLEAGAAGWIGISASFDEVEAAMREVVAGGSLVGRADRAALLDELRRHRVGTEQAQAWVECLTQREARVLAALVDGLTVEEIAETQFVALTTVRSQIRAVLRKLDVRSQVAAVAFAAPHRALLPQASGVVPERRRGHTGRRHPAA